jgi:hypothetical protein
MLTPQVRDSLSYVKTTKEKIIIFKTENNEGPWQVQLLNYVVFDIIMIFT